MGFMTELIWQSEFLIRLFAVAVSSFFIWALFWSSAMVRRFFLWREAKAEEEKGESQ